MISKKSVKKVNDEPENGIHISGKVINQINGPVSFYYLLPKQSNYPVCILFGDSHFSMDNSCVNCFENLGCYNIATNPEFYNLLEKAFPENIDMYLETYTNIDTDDFRDKLKGFQGGFMELFISNFEQCFPHSSKYDPSKCMTKNVRWHSADARNGNIKDDYIRVASIELALSRPFKLPYYGNYQYPHIQITRTLLKTLYGERSGNVGYNFREYANQFFRMITPKNSLIAKQLQKQPPHLKDVSFWEKVFVYVLQRHYRPISLNMSQKEIHDAIEQYGLPESFGNNKLNSLLNEITNINSGILDLYLLMRMFKVTDKTSKIVISYLGSNHIISISDALKRFFDYKLEYKLEDDISDNRCLQIDQPIFLEDDVNRINDVVDFPIVKKIDRIRSLIDELDLDNTDPYELEQSTSKIILIEKLIFHMKRGKYKEAEEIEDAIGNGQEMMDILTKISPSFTICVKSARKKSARKKSARKKSARKKSARKKSKNVII